MPPKSKLTGFEFYKRQTRRGASEPLVTITKAGTLTMNVPALRQLKVDAKHIEFAFNPEERLLGLLFVPEQTENSYKVRFSSSGTMQVSAAPMLKHYGLDHTERRTFVPNFEGDDFVTISFED